VKSKELFSLSEEVREAIADGLPVVAFESTVIAHGLPYPVNLETAVAVEQIARDNGVVPATIAVIGGILRAGLRGEELERLATREGIAKISRRDLPLAVARGWDGATTVATTSWIAHQVGIGVFSTGGVGGVHRGDLPDVSADLPELARLPVVVVCSGAKIILDLPATREWLETHGITLLGYGCDEMPAFYSRKSGLPVDARVDSPDEAAKIAIARRDLGLEGGVLVTVPVPEEFEVPQSKVETALATALLDASEKRIAGRELTPYLLSRLSEMTGGATLAANVALLKNNARVASEIAASISQSTA
jgi:pseudouridine-5'-phosphate glycosidase